MRLPIRTTMGLAVTISLLLSGCHFHGHVPPGQAKKVFVEPPPPGHAKWR